MIGQLIVRSFHARTAAHVLHLTTRSYATHKALQDFYDGIVPLIDALAESYTGLNGIIPDIHAPYIKPSDPVAVVADLADWIDDNRYKCCDKSETMLQNIIDEVLALCAATLYKLRTLK